jgi:hypothetical protein
MEHFCRIARLVRRAIADRAPQVEESPGDTPGVAAGLLEHQRFL